MTNKKPSSHRSALLDSSRKRSKWLLVPFVGLFVALGLVIILRSFASTPPTDPNDVLRGGFSTASEATARAQTITKLNSTAPENKGAKALFAYFGITEQEVNSAKLVAGVNPRTSSYANWLSFGRTQRPGSSALTVGGATFWSKPMKNAWVTGTSTTQPMLKGKTKDGRDFLIHAECGNLVMPNLTPYKGTPHATISKDAVSPAAGSKVKPGDIIKYRITVRSDGNTNAYATIADLVPVGTTFVSGEIETKNAIPIATETRNNQKLYRWANYGLAPNAVVKILVTVKVDAGTKNGFCNIAYLSWFKEQTIPAASQKICHELTTQTTPPTPPTPPTPGTPTLTVDKVAMSPAAGTVVKAGDVITYKVTGSNLGSTDATSVNILDGVQDNGWFEFVNIGQLTASTGQPVPEADISQKVTAKAVNGYKYYGYVKKTLKPKEVVSFTIAFKVVNAANPALKVCDLATISDSRSTDDNVWANDEVCHNVEGIEKHKSAIFLGRNGADGKPLPADGKNVARAGDEIQYTLTTKNKGGKALNDYLIEEDLKDVLEYTDVTDNGGGVLTSGILTWKVTIAANSTDTRMFKVKVKNPIPTQVAKPSSPGSYDYKMVNIYGDTVEIPVEKPITQTIIDTLPQTGALGLLMIPLVIATMLLLAYTSGVFGRSARRADTDVLQAPLQAGAQNVTHKPGDQFHPQYHQTADQEDKHGA